MSRIGKMRPIWAFLIGAFWINTTVVVAAGVDTLRAGLSNRDSLVVLVGFNGIVSKPGSGLQFGIGLEPAYFLAILAGLVMAGAGASRSLESGGGAERKPPATF